MAAWQRTRLTALSFLVVVLLLGFGCNSATDDPDVSDNLVVMTSADPTEACVDYDGVEEDVNGVPTIVYTGVTQTINLESRPRGTGGTSAWQDVIFTDVTITYEMDSGLAPPPGTFPVAGQLIVTSGGATAYPMVTVQAEDIADPNYFESGSRGRIVLEFSGEDVSGKPATATGNIRLFTASECEGGN